VRYFATRSIGWHREGEGLDAIARLAQEDAAEYVRIAAVDSLGKLGGPRAVSVLASLIASDDSDLACAALKSLGQIDHEDALPPLLEALRSAEPARRAEALQALGARGGKGAVEAMQWVAAADSESNVARTAVEALARLGTPEAVAALVNLTAEPARREDCVEALSRLGEQKIELIGRGLANAQPSVRRALVDALGRMKHTLASELLSQALDDQDMSVRLAAINALAHIGSRRAERKLVEMMRADPEAAVRRAAQKALSR
jgi:HEAT repeat protein